MGALRHEVKDKAPWARRYSVNRCLVVLSPSTPFVDWINRPGGSPYPLTIGDVQCEADVYLLDGEIVGSVDEAIKWVEQRWYFLFSQILSHWCMDREQWPSGLTFRMFCTWVEVHFHSLIWDMSGAALRKEDWDDESVFGLPAGRLASTRRINGAS